MEELFVGNSVILLFWVYISFIIDIDEYYKKIILMYLITYIANVLNIVPTFQSYECFLLGIHTVRKVCGGYQPATAGF